MLWIACSIKLWFRRSLLHHNFTSGTGVLSSFAVVSNALQVLKLFYCYQGGRKVTAIQHPDTASPPNANEDSDIISWNTRALSFCPSTSGCGEHVRVSQACADHWSAVSFSPNCWIFLAYVPPTSAAAPPIQCWCKCQPTPEEATLSWLTSASFTLSRTSIFLARFFFFFSLSSLHPILKRTGEGLISSCAGKEIEENSSRHSQISTGRWHCIYWAVCADEYILLFCEGMGKGKAHLFQYK